MGAFTESSTWIIWICPNIRWNIGANNQACCVGLVGYEKTIENIKMGIQETTICVKQKLFSSWLAWLLMTHPTWPLDSLWGLVVSAHDFRVQTAKWECELGIWLDISYLWLRTHNNHQKSAIVRWYHGGTTDINGPYWGYQLLVSWVWRGPARRGCNRDINNIKDQ